MKNWLAEWKDELPEETWITHLYEQFDHYKQNDEQALEKLNQKMRAMTQIAVAVGFYEDEDMEINRRADTDLKKQKKEAFI